MRNVLSLGLTTCLIFVLPAMAAQDKAASAAAARGNALSVSADSLGAMVLDQGIKLMMRDGTYIEGKVFRASQDEITMKVKNSEPKGRVRGSEATLSTSDISVVYIRKSGSIAAPIALGVLGGFAGALAGAYAAYNTNSEAAAFSALMLGVAGGASGGALLGREAVKKTVTINVSQPRQQGIAQ